MRPYYWREAAEGDSVSVIGLVRHTGSSSAELVAEDAVATEKSWYFARNAERPMALAGPLLVHALADAATDERRFLARLGPSRDGGETAPVKCASTPEALRFVGGRLRHSLGVRLRRKDRGARECWFVALRRKDGDGRFKPVPMPAGVQYTDPFLCQDAGRNWLFVEEIPVFGQKGRLVCREVLGEQDFGEPFVILDKPYHLSYPSVLRHEGLFFMVPESGDNNTVQLYSARRFPGEWQLEAVLAEGWPLRDTTPFLLDDTWYFFATLQEQGTETFLFTAARLEGPWRYHPANPVCTDTRRARGAGALFYRDGRLLRPSQDCAVRYGYAIVLNEITRLTSAEFAERPIETILPDWQPGILGTHTVNRGGGYEVIDGIRMG
jgi:hypothetical protein